MERKIVYLTRKGEVKHYIIGGHSRKEIQKAIEMLRENGNEIIEIMQPRTCRRCRGEGFIFIVDKSFEKFKGGELR